MYIYIYMYIYIGQSALRKVAVRATRMGSVVECVLYASSY
jgi:hypothetical protein